MEDHDDKDGGDFEVKVNPLTEDEINAKFLSLAKCENNTFMSGKWRWRGSGRLGCIAGGAGIGGMVIVPICATISSLDAVVSLGAEKFMVFGMLVGGGIGYAAYRYFEKRGE